MNVQLPDSVKYAVDCIINNDNNKIPPEIEVTRGSETGDGYASKTFAISINSNNGKVVKLFVKYLPEMEAEWRDVMALAFHTEFRFYNEIYPAFNSFQENRNIKEPFNNVPKHYTTSIKNGEAPPIILENLRSLGYTLRDRKKPVDDAHLRLPIKAFARYHAISYAVKDQEPQSFNDLSTGITDFFTKFVSTFETDKMTIQCVTQFIDVLDPISDKKILDRCKNLAEVLVGHIKNINNEVDEYAVIGQGDCWSNNVMFLYDDETGLPVDVKLIDWQCQRVNSPFLDFSYFFYTLATKEILDNAESYLNLYYNTLSERIKQLGSDPEKMYPYEIFRNHWRKFSLFGLAMAFCIVKAQLFEADEVPDLLDETKFPGDTFAKPIKHQEKYVKRIKDLVEYFIENELL